MKETARFVPEKFPSCENCIHYKPYIKNGKITARGSCLAKQISVYKQRHEICKKNYKAYRKEVDNG